MLGRQESARILQRVALPRGRVGTTPKQRVATKYTSTYVRACRALFGPFDGQGYMELNQLRPMLERHRLLDPHDEGAAAKLDAWLQRPRDGHITFLDFVDACFTLVGPSLAAKWMDGTTSRHDMSPTTSLSTVSTTTDSRLHPFDAMKDQHKHAMEFSYADHVETDPMQAQRLQDATTLSHSHSLVMDTPYRCIRRVVSEQDLHEQAAGDTAKKAVKVKAQRHLASEHRKKVEARQAHARNFSCSVGMVARHIQIGEIKEKRQLGLQEKVALVHWRKHDDQRSRSEMEDFNARVKLTKIQDMHLMKAHMHDKLMFEQQKKEYREEMIRRQKDLFTISDSTCTLLRRPPELLAALAGVQTPKQQKMLAMAERRYVEQSRSQQLRDYKHDKDDAKPKRYLRAPIIDVDQQDPDKAWHNEEAELTAAMNALYAEWVQEQRDLSPLIPTANSPPAALRYYGTIKQLPPSPFMSSTER